MSETRDRLDEAYDWLWEAEGCLARARNDWAAGDYEGAQHKVAEAEDLLDDVDKTLKAVVGP